MIRWLRIIAALVSAWALLETANWAVRDCSTGPNTVENCLWQHVRSSLALPASKFLRAAVLEVTGLIILAGLWGTFHYIWPHGQPKAPETSASPNLK